MQVICVCHLARLHLGNSLRTSGQGGKTSRLQLQFEAENCAFSFAVRIQILMLTYNIMGAYRYTCHYLLARAQNWRPARMRMYMDIYHHYLHN